DHFRKYLAMEGCDSLLITHHPPCRFLRAFWPRPPARRVRSLYVMYNGRNRAVAPHDDSNSRRYPCHSSLSGSSSFWRLPLPTVHGQGAIPPRHLAAKKQLQRLAADMTASCLNDVQSVADWEKKRPS